MKASIEAEINRTARLGAQLERLIYNKSKEGKLIVVGENDDLLMAYWSLIFDYGKGIGCLLHHEFYSSAFALLRPMFEALVRAGVVLAGTPDDVQKIRKDTFVMNFKKDGALIDKTLNSGTMTNDFLNRTRELLHSLTHSGIAQVGMRFDNLEIGGTVSDGQIKALLNSATNAVFLITIVVAKHYNLSDEARAANELLLEYGKQQLVLQQPTL